jgi:hypothetical protein
VVQLYLDPLGWVLEETQAVNARVLTVLELLVLACRRWRAVMR